MLKMKPSQIWFLLVAIILGFGEIQSSGQANQPKARKFDELTMGIGTPRSWWVSNIREQENEMKARLLHYARQLRKEGARAYIIGYSPRILEWEIYDRSYGDMRAGQARERLSEFFDYRRITSIDGGFRETAITELWIVPPGAETPKPTPTIKPEEVSHCPFLRVIGVAYVPKPNKPLELKAIVESNDKKIQPTFTWKVSRGVILSGQGTDSIKIDLSNADYRIVATTVTVIGYSLECPVETTTKTVITTIGVEHFLFDEFGNINSEDEAARLDNLAITLQNDPTLQVHVTFYGGRVGYRNEALARAARMKSYLVQSRGIEAARVITIDGGYRNGLSGELWLSMRGTGAPRATPSVDRKYVKFRGQVRVSNSRPCSF